MENLLQNRLNDEEESTDFSKLEHLCNELEELGAVYREYVVVNDTLHERKSSQKGSNDFEDTGAME